MGSVVRKITRPVKKAVKSVAKVAKSDVGKAALAAAGLYYLGGGTFGGLRSTATGFSPLNLKAAVIGTPTGASELGASRGIFGAFGKFNPFEGSLAKGFVDKPFRSIAGISALSGLLAAEDQKSEEEIAAMSPEERNRYVSKLRAAYTANLARGFPGVGSVPYAMAAEGGRVGMAEGSGGFESAKDFIESTGDEELMDMYIDVVKGIRPEEALLRLLRKKGYQTYAVGGQVDMPTGIMRTNAAGIKERDYRDEGGFVPVGIKEKADDVPAMLSKNEFVMTADAVRGAGDGSIEKGAQKMYDTMKKLEDKVA